MAGLLLIIVSALTLLPAALSLTLSFPRPFHSTTPSNFSGLEPYDFPPCVVAGDWPQAPCRYHIPRTDLIIGIGEYGNRFPLSWGQNVAQNIHDIETVIRRNPRSGIISGPITSGPVRVRFYVEEKATGPLFTAPEAVQVLATMWSFTIAFGAREIWPCLIFKTPRYWEQALFRLDIDLDALNHTGRTDIF